TPTLFRSSSQRVHLTGYQSRRSHIRRDLNELSVQTLVTEKAAVLRDVKVNKCDAPARDGDLHSLRLRCHLDRPAMRNQGANQKNSSHDDTTDLTIDRDYR